MMDKINKPEKLTIEQLAELKKVKASKVLNEVIIVKDNGNK